MTTRARGTFEVTLTPQPAEDAAGGAAIGRMWIAKTFRGDLEGASVGQMIAHRTAVAGSAGYAAIEQVTGSLHGRAGTFVLQHSGTLTRGTPGLAISVVPDSGTGELAGLAGTFSIVNDDGKHSYEFDYSLAPPP